MIISFKLMRNNFTVTANFYTTCIFNLILNSTNQTSNRLQHFVSNFISNFIRLLILTYYSFDFANATNYITVNKSFRYDLN